MLNTARKEEVTQSSENNIEAIKDFPQEAAEAVRPFLREAGLAEYKSFLNMMYHYTFDSANKLTTAAKAAPNKELEEYFQHMADEERWHYMLAKRDLQALGSDVDEETPQVIKDFNDFWYSLGKKNINEYVGALYVFESIADFVAEDVVAFIKRLSLQAEQAKWLSIHVEADHEHGDQAREMCEKYIANDTEAMTTAANGAKDHWIKIFKQAFGG